MPIAKHKQESERLKELDFLLDDNLSNSVSSEEEKNLEMASTSFEL
jgi:hypothetical protein